MALISDPVSAVSAVVGKVLDRVLPDKSANDAAKAALLNTEVQGEIAAIAGQLEVNKAEAASLSVFVAGWRPFVGWVCGAAFAYNFVLQPFFVFLVVVLNVHFDVTRLPKLDMTTMLTILGGMLGFGAMRTADKIVGAGNGE